MNLSLQIKKIAEPFPFMDLDICAIKNPMSLAFYESWLEAGFHGDMDYLKRHLPLKKNAERLMANVESAIVVLRGYRPHPYPSSNLPKLNIASYAQGKDYHQEFLKELNTYMDLLKGEFPEHKFLAMTDSQPVLERDLAYRAGLGWFGKNTCLIKKDKGSFFLIGEIYTTLKTTAAVNPAHDHCGTCNRCIEACPTGALVEPKKLDARKCISYWTIESKKVAPKELREKFNDMFFGCDICQIVCPWNARLGLTALDNSNQNIVAELRKILQASDSDLLQRFSETPLARAKPKGLKRNAIVVAGNLGLKELQDDIATYAVDTYFKELVSWYVAKVRPD